VDFLLIEGKEASIAISGKGCWRDIVLVEQLRLTPP